MKVLSKLRIEIQNDLAIPRNDEKDASDSNGIEKMDVDGTTGERVSAKDRLNIIYRKNQNDEKNEKREKRKELTEADVKKVYETLGVSPNENQIYRLEAIHLRGTEELSTDDIFEYFSEFVPSHIEWISDESCNVVWEKKQDVVKVLHYLSKPINGMPLIGACDPFVSSLVSESDKIYCADGIDISQIVAPVPPGYWRLGNKHLKADYLLMRFAKKTDRKSAGAEKFSDFYKKYGNPNYNNIPGLISQSKKSIIRKNRIKEILLENKLQFGEQTNAAAINTLSSTKKRDDYEEERRRRNDSVAESLNIKKQDRFFRMKMYADEEEQKGNSKKSSFSFASSRLSRRPSSSLPSWLSSPSARNVNPTTDLRNRINQTASAGNVFKAKSDRKTVWSRIERKR